MMQSLNYILNNGVRVVLLLVDFMPKIDSFNDEFLIKDLLSYVELVLDNHSFYC